MSFHVYVETHAKIKACVKLDMMPSQTNVKITAAHMNYRVSKKQFSNGRDVSESVEKV